ncbi:MAG: transposase [Candidatus Eisenbacteria bacterium]|nr:transposase [Candidatus Eisenbacteria bacterium]
MLWAVVESYLTRWKVEEMIRFLKQSYHLEDIRVLTYRRLRNLVALVLAASFFAVVHLGERLQVAVLARRVLKAAKRIYGVPAFHCYALADGIAAILRRTGQGPLCQFLRRKPPPVTLQTALEGL